MTLIFQFLLYLYFFYYLFFLLDALACYVRRRMGIECYVLFFIISLDNLEFIIKYPDMIIFTRIYI